jgi:uncharacterized membrane protein
LSHSVVVHRYHGSVLTAFLAVLMVFILILLLITVGELAFERIGFNPLDFTLILIGTLAGSLINIPVAQMKSTQPLVEVQETRIFGLYFRMPRIRYQQVSTTLAVNVGGAVIPVIVSVYLLATHASLLLGALAGVIVTAFLVHLMARKVKGVGIVTPALLPPLCAAIIAYLLVPGSPAIVAYISGTLGALIGADLTNLRGTASLGASMMSIGGAGTFDGVFLTGLVAVLLVPLL